MDRTCGIALSDDLNDTVGEGLYLRVTEELAEAATTIVPVYDTIFGKGVVAGTLKKDLDNSSSKTFEAYKLYPEERKYIENFINHEIAIRGKENVRKDKASGVRNLLWMKRALQFVLQFLEALQDADDQKTSKECANQVYAKVLKPYHGLIVSTVVTTAFNLCPTKQDLFNKLGFPDSGVAKQKICGLLENSGMADDKDKHAKASEESDITEEKSKHWIEISNLPWDYLELDISRASEKFGSISSIECMDDRAYVCYGDPDVAMRAIAALDQTNFLGNIITCSRGSPAIKEILRDSDVGDDQRYFFEDGGEDNVGGPTTEVSKNTLHTSKSKKLVVAKETNGFEEASLSQSDDHAGAFPRDKRAGNSFLPANRGRYGEGGRVSGRPFDPSYNRPRGDGPPTSVGRGRRTDYRILLFNLDDRVSWQDLKDFGRIAGDVNFSNVFSRFGRKTGIIEYYTSEAMQRAVTDLHGRRLYDKRLHVEQDCGQAEPQRAIAFDDAYPDQRMEPAVVMRPGGRPTPGRPAPYRHPDPVMIPPPRAYKSRSRSPRVEYYPKNGGYGNNNVYGDRPPGRHPQFPCRPTADAKSSRTGSIRDGRGGTGSNRSYDNEGYMNDDSEYMADSSAKRTRKSPPFRGYYRQPSKTYGYETTGGKYERRRRDEVTPPYVAPHTYGYRVEKEEGRGVDRRADERFEPERIRAKRTSIPRGRDLSPRGREISPDKSKKSFDYSRSSRKNCDDSWHREKPGGSSGHDYKRGPFADVSSVVETENRNSSRRHERKIRLGTDDGYRQISGSRRAPSR